MKYQDKVDFINELLECENEEVQLLDGFESSLIGYDITNGTIPTPLYDGNKMIDILVKRDHMSVEEAIEYIDYNVINSIPKNDDHYPRIVSIFKNKKRK